ncbi:MAG: gluconate 2-dehydrogenase subunit 3 family protein [Methyloligellaceae bacterium]
MRTVDKRARVSRRDFLATSGAAALVVSSGAVMCPTGAWAMKVKTLKPETMRTLIQMARDIYPHDRLADKYYAKAVKSYDVVAAKEPALKALIEDGVNTLDSLAKGAHGTPYIDVGWEADRVALLRQIEKGGFFQKVRGGLVTGLYNNPEVWAKVGYEGPSAEKGGYIKRGFNDIDWV